MHTSALINAKHFFDTYVTSTDRKTVIDIGAQDINGSIRDVAPTHLNYIGVDFVAAKGVDVILTDPYQLPFETESVDIVVCSSCFEHSEMFWVLFLEIMRILRPNGLLYLNVPSNGSIHRYPFDCWRFYPDSGQALVTWAKRNNYSPMLLESFISEKIRGVWNDCISIYLKDESFASNYPSRIIEHIDSFSNGRMHGTEKLLRHHETPEDQRDLFTAIKYRFWVWLDSKAAKKRNRLNNLTNPSAT